MARLVVLEFDDNTQAETLIDDWWRALQSTPASEDGTVRVDLLTPVQENNVQCKVVGLFARPTVFCNPADDLHRGRGKTGRGWTRGTKYGWWVCAVCKKPSRMWGEGLQSVLAGARNLLQEFLCDHSERSESADGIHQRCLKCNASLLVEDIGA